MELILINFLHEIVLSVLLISLVLWKKFPDASAYKWIITLLLIVLGYDLFINQSDLISKLYHLSIDLILLSSIAFFVQQIQTNSLRVLGMTLAILAIFYTHKLIFDEHPAIESYVTEELMENGELLIELKHPSFASAVQSNFSDDIIDIRPAFQMKTTATSNLDEYFLVDIADGKEVSSILESLKTLEKVVWAEKNQIIQVPKIEEIPFKSSRAESSSDPLLNEQWISDNYDLNAFHNRLTKMAFSNADHISIAILDTGVDGKHEDLIGNYSSLKAEYDVDTQGHGTHCAGIAAAVSNNNIGIASLSPEAGFIRLTSVKVLNVFGFGFQSTIIQGMIEAVDMGVDVISMSLGTYTTEESEKAYTDAVRYANENNVIVLAAAGNSSQNAKQHSPANTPGLICVAAVDKNFNKAVFSNHIEDIEMGIYAPGVNIMSTFPSNKYVLKSGTSMATPFIAGLAGIAKKLNPQLTNIEFYDLMIETSIKKDDILIVNPNKVLNAILEIQEK